MRYKYYLLLLIITVAAVVVYMTTLTAKLPQVAPGFSVSIFADKLDNPGFVVFDEKNRAIVSEPKAGKVILLPDMVLLEGLKYPSGLEWYQDYLYVAETYQVSRWKYDVEQGKLIDTAGTNIANLVASDLHPLHPLLFGPNYRSAPIIKGTLEKETSSPTKLYIGAGSSCDVCVEETWKRAAVLESDPEGTFTAEYAGGLRNPTGLAIHPTTQVLWATEQSTDGLPDEINILQAPTSAQKFGARRYGWPFCYGNRVKDETFKPEKIERIDIPTDCSKTDAPVIEIPAHSAPLGLVFIPINFGWPKEWEGDLLVAFHGSWNKSEPTGYKIVRFKVDKTGKVSETADFIT